MLEGLELCLFQLYLLHVILLDLFEPLLFQIVQLTLEMLEILMHLFIVLVGFPLNVPILVPSEFFDTSLLLVGSIRRLKHFLVLHLTLVLVQLNLTIISLFDTLELKLMHLRLLLLFILESFFNTASDLLPFYLGVFPRKLFLLEQA